MNHQSLRDVFVVNNPALFKSGFSDELAIGQLGIFEADPNKDRTAIAAPKFPANKSIMFVQGTREVPVNLLGAIANASKPSKTIKGKKILDFTGRKAERGHNQIITIGYDGLDTNKTISAKCEESKHVYLKLSGGPIDQMFHTEGKGYVRQYSLFSGCCDDCGDNCADVSAENMAKDLARQINEDPILNLGTRLPSRLIRASVISNSTPAVADGNCIEYLLDVCDNGDDVSLGLVQAQYSGFKIVRKSRTGSTSTYALILDDALDAPAAFSNAGLTVISDCPTCPAGYTLTGSQFAYKITKADAGDAVAMAAVATEYGITSPESISRINYQFGQSTYIVLSATALASLGGVNEVQSLVATGGTAGTFTLTFIGQTTAPIAFDATAAEVQAALEALSNVNPGDIVAAGGPLPATPVTLTFGGQYAGQDVPALVVADSVTDGDAVITTTTPGVAASEVVELVNAGTRNTCVITTPETVAWVEGETLDKFNKVFSITLRDNVCGESRLAELQAAFPSLVISEAAANEDTCTRRYETTVESNCVPAGCDPGVAVWVAPDAFDGVKWVGAADAAGNGTAWGVKLESTWVDLVVNDCAFEYWRYDAEPMFIEVSQHSQDYNDKPTICATEWPVTEVQAIKLPIGVGSSVREQEAFFKGYERKYRDCNPIVREYQDSVLQTDPNAFYDQYTLKFEFDYHQSWFSEKNTDTYRLEFYFPEGKGKEFEAAINGYISSVGIDIEPVVL
jgi:hypothetical protein